MPICFIQLLQVPFTMRHPLMELFFATHQERKRIVMLSHFRIRLSIPGSATRCSTNFISHPCSMASKNLVLSSFSCTGCSVKTSGSIRRTRPGWLLNKRPEGQGQAPVLARFVIGRVATGGDPYNNALADNPRSDE